MDELPNTHQTATDTCPNALMPPGWERLDWSRHRGGVLSIEARRLYDEKKVTVRIDTLPAAFEQDYLTWFKQVLDLKLLWAVS